MLGGQAARAGTLGHLDHQQAIGIGGGAVELGVGAARVQGEAAPAVLVGRGGHGRHHARALLLEQGREAPEVRGREADVGALVAERALDRPPEAGEDVDAGVRVRLRPGEEQGAPDPQLLPVVAVAQRGHEGGRLAWSERDRERVAGPHARRPRPH